MATYDDIGGVWRTIGGRRVFIKNGQDLPTAMKESGKFGKNKDKLETLEHRRAVNTHSVGRKDKDEINRLDEEIGKEYRDRLGNLKGKEDGTYDLATGKKVDFGSEGYNVSFEQSTDNFTNAEYYAKIRECQTACDGKVYGGVFGGDPEISFYTKDINVAKNIMYKYNQHSIWSNELDDVITNEKYDEKKNKVNYKG